MIRGAISLALCSIVYASALTTRQDSGCGAASTWQFDASSHSNQTLRDRSFLVHLPADYNSSVAHAVVFSYHGFHGNDTQQELISGLSESGLEINGKGIIAVYPNGAYGPGKTGDDIERAWQGAPYAKPGVDDVSFTQDIISAIKSNLCVDERRIYVTGKSNGGGMVNLLACTPSTAALIAAFAPISAALYAGTLPLEGCNPGRKIALLNFHGLEDHITPFGGRSEDKKGDTAYALPNITLYREAWATRNGCRTTRSTSISHPHTDTTLKVWDCSASGVNAVTKGFTVGDLGHSWPSTQGLDGGTTDFNATTSDIIPFFNDYLLV